MDKLFADNVPDIGQWGKFQENQYTNPRRYIFTLLEITPEPGSPRYLQVVQEMACAVANARLPGSYAEPWKKAVEGRVRLTDEEREPIARALMRGICRSGSDWRQGVPPCNDESFKAHLAEVLLYCVRIYLLERGGGPLIFQPPTPKMNPNSPGIDLLEVGRTGRGYYFHVWECKGTDESVAGALAEAANQLTSPQSAVGTGTHYGESDLQCFAAGISSSVDADAVHCHLVVIKIHNFAAFRGDVYRVLWSIW